MKIASMTKWVPPNLWHFAEERILLGAHGSDSLTVSVWISNTAAGSWVQNVTFVEPSALLSFCTFCAQNRQYLAKVNFDTLFFSLTLDAVLNSHPLPRSPTFSCEETDE